MTDRPTTRSTDQPHAAGRADMAACDGREGACGFDAPWVVAVGASLRLTMVIAGGHAAAAAAVMVAQAPLGLAVALYAAIAASAVLHLARLARVALPQSIVGLEVAGNGRVQARRRDGQMRGAWLLPSTVVGSRLTVIRLRLDGQRLPCDCLLLSDNCEPEAFRRLRAGLVWQAGPALQRRNLRAD
ncbi:MAG: hypothetical protein ING90_16800 [Rhodocyclaceae bacterium]|jgi:hypothetical protein|nr:hypothetical protein [Rhodocyclaceae bacterium]MCE2978514.1 hypothetical protein [Betaproteobacteria bacterium]MCA3073687.1 hypothetical protein [Rhodocyclaceae bacterium]MCA3088956.1 hypothetical protein [Rhodocyclaceae bacterium]MCA3095692.1 hypothetical protein [Rhodocyclaceae bacterium]